MKAVSYSPSNDELVLRFSSLKKKPMFESGRFKLWWDDEGTIYRFCIVPFSQELEEFKKNMNTIRLGGIWKGIRITEEDIKEIRKDLLEKVEVKW